MPIRLMLAVFLAFGISIHGQAVDYNTIEGRKPFNNGVGPIETLYVIRVTERLKTDKLKPNTPEVLEVVRFGAPGDSRLEADRDFPHFKKGDDVIFFLKWSRPMQHYVLSSGPDSAYAVTEDHHRTGNS